MESKIFNSSHFINIITVTVSITVAVFVVFNRELIGTVLEAQLITIIDCLHAHLNVKNKKVRLELWDTGGQDRFRTIVKQYFRKADGVLLIYDVTNICSFHRLSSWLEELRTNNEKAVVVIVGNKIDHEGSQQVSKATVQRYAESEQLEYFESSAKSGENVYQIFEHLTEKILIAKGMLEAPVPDVVPPPSPMTPPVILSEDRGIICLKAEAKRKKKKKKQCCSK